MVKKAFTIITITACIILSHPALGVNRDAGDFLKTLEERFAEIKTYRCVMTSENWKGS